MRVHACATQLDRKRKTYAGRNVSFYTLSDQPLPVTIGEYAEMCILQIVNFHSRITTLAPHQTQSTYHRLPETSWQINTPDQLADHTYRARRMDKRHLSTKYEKGTSRGSL